MVRASPGNPRSFKFYVWELHILCREILLHAEGNSDALSTFDGLVKHINYIRELTKGISERTIDSGDGALQALFPLVHQQARWQHSLDEARIFRAFHIYSDHNLANIFENVTGISMVDMCALSLTIGGITKNRVDINTSQDYSVVGVTPKVRDTFFNMTAKTIDGIRHELAGKQKYDESWAYTWNPLEAWPLINLDGSSSSKLWCPLPELLLRRITEGLFYDLGKSKEQFGEQYGRAFERYVGKVLLDIFPSDGFEICGEQSYKVRNQNKHGVDWIVSDSTGNMLIECKARRLLHEAKESANGKALKQSLENLADAVVQLYKNIDDVVSSRSKWLWNGFPIYPFVVTYEDWYLSTPHVVNYLIECVQCKLDSANLPRGLIEENPFFVTSIAELERAGQAISHLGIERFCACREISMYRYFHLSGLAPVAFPAEKITYRQLFKESWIEMFPHLKHMLDKLRPAGPL